MQSRGVKTSHLAVELGLDPSMGLEGQDSFPFLYTLVNKEKDTWQPSSGIAPLPLLNHLTPNGIPIAPGGKVQYPVILDPDYNFKLLSVKYGAYGINPNILVAFPLSTVDPNGKATIAAYITALRTAGEISSRGIFQITISTGGSDTGDRAFTAAHVAAGETGGAFPGDAYQWNSLTSVLTYLGTYPVEHNLSPSGYSVWDWINDAYSAGLDPDMQKVGEPLYGYLAVTLYMMSAGAKILYGGIEAGAGLPTSGTTVPLPMRPMQAGPDSGFLSARTPYLLPRSGTLIFEVTNNHPSISLYPNALIYGIKVRI